MKRIGILIAATMVAAIATIVPASASSVFTNPGFETGTLSSWTIDGSNPAPTTSIDRAHTGTYSVLVGALSGAEPNGDGSFYQAVTIPASGSTELSYWYDPYTADTITFDWQDAYVTDSSGTILATVMHVASDAETWQHVTFDMTPYAGQDVRIKFLVHEDGFNDDTGMFVDDVTLTPTPTSLSINAPSSVAAGNRAKVHGSLASSDLNCEDTQPVLLHKGSSTVGPKMTSSSGAYSFETKITNKTTVKVTYAGTASCAPSSSPRKTIKVN